MKASPETVASAGESAVDSMDGDLLATNIWNQSGENAYPIASFTYLIVYKDLRNLKTKEQAAALVAYLKWATHDGQKFDAELDYAPLKESVQKKIDTVLSHISFGGSPVASK